MRRELGASCASTATYDKSLWFGNLRKCHAGGRIYGVQQMLCRGGRWCHVSWLHGFGQKMQAGRIIVGGCMVLNDFAPSWPLSVFRPGITARVSRTCPRHYWFLAVTHSTFRSMSPYPPTRPKPRFFRERTKSHYPQYSACGSRHGCLKTGCTSTSGKCILTCTKPKTESNEFQTGIPSFWTGTLHICSESC